MKEHPSLTQTKPKPAEKPPVTEYNLEETLKKLESAENKVQELTESFKIIDGRLEGLHDRLDALEALEKRALELLIKRLEG